jgi:hypothetical protein
MKQLLVLIVLAGALASGIIAQSANTEIRRGEVVYVSGNDLVVKMENDEVKHFTVPSSFTFKVDGKDLKVNELRPGMKLTQTITTTTETRTVTEAITIRGRVWQVMAPKSVILTLPDGTNRQYNVPENTHFVIDGQNRTVFDLRPGMNVTANVVRSIPETVSRQQMQVKGTAPVVKAVAAPPPVHTTGALLIISEVPAPQPTAAAAPAPRPTPTPAPAAPAPAPKLPKTASPAPLFGLLGFAALGLGLALRKLS